MGAWTRKGYFMTDKHKKYKEFPIHFMGKLMNDFSGSTNSLLIPGVEVYIDLELNESRLFLLSNTQKEAVPYSYEIHDIHLHVALASMTETVFKRFNATLLQKPALYNLRKTNLS